MVPSYKNISVCAVILAALSTIPGTATAIPATFVDLGVIGTPGSYTFDTTGSINANGGNTDTELALWDMSGTLLDSDDDGLGFPFSVITATLSEGMYFLGISEFQSIFADNFLNTASAFEPGDIATLALNINGGFAGSAVGSDQLDQETAFFKVTVSSVPSPATVALVGLGVAGIGYSRRKQIKAA